MVTRCLFGLFVFGSNSTLTYRFLTDDLFTYLYKRFIDRGYIFDENLGENVNKNEDVSFSFDDVIAQHFSTLINFYSQTIHRNSPIRQITLESNIQIFFDQMGENKIIYMTDETFNTIIILKIINLFKSLVKFHLGALRFTKSPTVSKLMNRISSSLQYYLNNITTNQALLFESCEYLHINSLIRQQCLQACTSISHDVQSWLHVPPTMILITCKDKIVYKHLNKEENRPNTSDLFLLLLNNTTRSLRNQFKLQELHTKSKMAHIYKINNDDNNNQTILNSERTSAEPIHLLEARRAHSLPNFPELESMKIHDSRRIEVVFMKTQNRTLAPFTMYTVTLTKEISVLILVEWKRSLACSHLSELLRLIDLSINQSKFPYNELSNQIKYVGSNGTIRQYFKNTENSSNVLSNIWNDIQRIYKSSPKSVDITNEDDPVANQIFNNLTKMITSSINAFHYLFFDSDEYVLLTNNNDSQQNDNIIEPPMIQNLRNKLFGQLGDWFSFIEIKSQRNITMSFCHNEFSGLVHFALIDRSRGHICTPSLYNEDYQHYSTTTTNNNITNTTEQFLEQKILAFELDCLSALQRGYTSYTMTDEYFTYNYTLRLQERNGASMRIYRHFVTSQPPGILHYDFYKALACANYSTLVDETSIGCFELICVHLRIVPSSNVREQCEQLWPRLMELDE